MGSMRLVRCVHDPSSSQRAVLALASSPTDVILPLCLPTFLLAEKPIALSLTAKDNTPLTGVNVSHSGMNTLQPPE